MIMLGYKEAKSKPVTGRLFSRPFSGGNTYAPGNFPDVFWLEIFVVYRMFCTHASAPKRLDTFVPIA